jgi:hypothetical protein
VKPHEGLIGTVVNVRGWYFSPGENVLLSLGRVSGVAETKTDGKGSFETSFTLPKFEPGLTFVRVTEQKSGYQVEAPFAIPVPYIDADLAEFDTGIIVSGWNFKPNEGIQIYLGDKEIGRAATDDRGYFENTYKVLESFPLGKTYIRVIGVDSDYEERIPFVVVPRYVFIDVEPEEGVIGSQVTVYGWNFGPNEDIRIDFGDNKGIAQATTDAEGDFEKTFEVPTIEPGVKFIRAAGLQSESEATASFHIPPPGISVSPDKGSIGTEVTVEGWNFGAGEEIRIYFGDREVTRTKANEKGYFEVVFTVPEDIPVGKTDIRVVGIESGYDVKFKFHVIIVHDQGTGESP